jgi:hypothetical protein
MNKENQTDKEGRAPRGTAKASKVTINDFTNLQEELQSGPTKQTCSASQSYQTTKGTFWLHLSVYVTKRPGTLYYYAEGYASFDRAGEYPTKVSRFELDFDNNEPYVLENATGLKTETEKSSDYEHTATAKTTGPKMGPLTVKFPC